MSFNHALSVLAQHSSIHVVTTENIIFVGKYVYFLQEPIRTTIELWIRMVRQQRRPSWREREKQTRDWLGNILEMESNLHGWGFRSLSVKHTLHSCSYVI